MQLQSVQADRVVMATTCWLWTWHTFDLVECNRSLGEIGVEAESGGQNLDALRRQRVPELRILSSKLGDSHLSHHELRFQIVNFAANTQAAVQRSLIVIEIEELQRQFHVQKVQCSSAMDRDDDESRPRGPDRTL